MEKVNGKYILEGEFVRFDTVNRNGSRIYKDDFYTEYYKNIKRIIKIWKIWTESYFFSVYYLFIVS
jgi:hypothetical protein